MVAGFTPEGNTRNVTSFPLVYTKLRYCVKSDFEKNKLFSVTGETKISDLVSFMPQAQISTLISLIGIIFSLVSYQ